MKRSWRSARFAWIASFVIAACGSATPEQEMGQIGDPRDGGADVSEDAQPDAPADAKVCTPGESCPSSDERPWACDKALVCRPYALGELCVVDGDCALGCIGTQCDEPKCVEPSCLQSNCFQFWVPDGQACGPAGGGYTCGAGACDSPPCMNIDGGC